MNELFSSAKESYLMNCASNTLSPGTVSNYERVIRLFEQSAIAHGFNEPCVQAVAAWKLDMMKSGMKITTLASYMTMAKHFFDWAMQMEYYTKNPFMPTVMPVAHVVSREKKKPYTKLLSKEDFNKILNAPLYKFGKRGTAIRNKTIIIVFMTTAIRNSELRALVPADLDFEKGIIHIRKGKGNKSRYVAFPKITQKAVKEYLDSGFRPADKTDEDLLFATRETWEVMHRTTLSENIRSIIQNITGQSGIRTHALRHACASIMWDNGVPIDEISTLLGHESIATTQIYAERLRPTIPMENANKMFDNIFDNVV